VRKSQNFLRKFTENPAKIGVEVTFGKVGTKKGRVKKKIEKRPVFDTRLNQIVMGVKSEKSFVEVLKGSRRTFL